MPAGTTAPRRSPSASPGPTCTSAIFPATRPTAWSARSASPAADPRGGRGLSSPGCARFPPRSTPSRPVAPPRSRWPGPALLGNRLLTKDLAFPDVGARRVPAARPAPGSGPDDRGAGGARARAPAPQDGRPRGVHRPGRAPGSQRDAVLPAPRRPPGRVPADRLHPDGRPRLRRVQPHHPADARRLDHARGPRPDPGSCSGRGPTRTSG